MFAGTKAQAAARLVGIENSGGEIMRRNWEQGALYTTCSHFVAEAWVPIKNDHTIAGRCPRCRAKGLRPADRALSTKTQSEELTEERKRLRAIEEGGSSNVVTTKAVDVSKVGSIQDAGKTWAFELSLAPERKLALAKIFEDHSLDFDTVKLPAAKEAAAPYMAELEEESGIFDAAAFVFWKRHDDGCIQTAVFTLGKNDFGMDWTPSDDPHKKEEFFKKKQAYRRKEVENKTFWMGMVILRHQFEPLGTFCISLQDEESDDELEVPIVWRFARPPVTPEKQDFLEVVAKAHRFSEFAAREWWSEDCVFIDFWKRDDGTFAFHFSEAA
jgi:hypothetical protein